MALIFRTWHMYAKEFRIMFHFSMSQKNKEVLAQVYFHISYISYIWSIFNFLKWLHVFFIYLSIVQDFLFFNSLLPQSCWELDKRWNTKKSCSFTLISLTQTCCCSVNDFSSPLDIWHQKSQPLWFLIWSIWLYSSFCLVFFWSTE